MGIQLVDKDEYDETYDDGFDLNTFGKVMLGLIIIVAFFIFVGILLLISKKFPYIIYVIGIIPIIPFAYIIGDVFWEGD